MIRFLLRFLGLWVLAAGFVSFVYDGTKSIADNTLYYTRIGDAWSNVHQASLLALQPTLERYAAWLWKPVTTTLLNQPVWLAFVVVGAVLILLGRKKRPLIGYSRS